MRKWVVYRLRLQLSLRNLGAGRVLWGDWGRSLGQVVPPLAPPPVLLPTPGPALCQVHRHGRYPLGYKVRQEITPPEAGGSTGAGFPPPRLGPGSHQAPSPRLGAPAPPARAPGADSSGSMTDRAARLAALILLGAAVCGEWVRDSGDRWGPQPHDKGSLCAGWKAPTTRRPCGPRLPGI